jgi:hypothetical protein
LSGYITNAQKRQFCGARLFPEIVARYAARSQNGSRQGLKIISPDAGKFTANDHRRSDVFTEKGYVWSNGSETDVISAGLSDLGYTSGCFIHMSIGHVGKKIGSLLLHLLYDPGAAVEQKAQKHDG